MNKFAVIAIVLLLGVQLNKAQNQVPSIPTPNAYSFAKFGEVQVNEYNGLPDISIPVYTLKDGMANIPITLRYHAGGIKVAEEASWVGLGWNLDVGGVITQIIEGLDDNWEDYGRYSGLTKKEAYSPYFKNYSYDWFFEARNTYTQKDISASFNSYQRPDAFDIQNSVFARKCLTCGYYCCVDPSHNHESVLYQEKWSYEHNFIKDLQAGYFKPDIYSYSILGKSGKMAFNNINDWTKANDVLTHFKFENLSGNISVTDPDGVNYLFNEFEESYSQQRIDRAVNFTDVYVDGELMKTSRTYYLTDIYYPNGQHVNFAYSTNNPSAHSMPNRTENCSYGALNDDGEVHTTDTRNVYTPRYLKTISTDNFEVTFTTKDENGGRLDVNGEKRLSNIVVYDKHSTKSRKFIFDTDYFTSTRGANTSYSNTNDDNCDIYRLKLTQFYEEGQNPYKFTYNSLMLPSKTSFAVDYWGFYNGAVNNTNLIPNIVTKKFASYTWSNRELSSTNIVACMLEKVEYPTGGYTTYSFEPNTYRPEYETAICAGLRIKRISSFSGDGSVISKDYQYEFDGLSSGKLMSPLKYVGTDPFVECEPDHSWTAEHLTRISSNSTIAISSDAQGSLVGYDSVKIITQNSGSIVKQFINNPSISTSTSTFNLFNVRISASSIEQTIGQGCSEGYTTERWSDKEWFVNSNTSIERVNSNSAISLPPINDLANGSVKIESVYDVNDVLVSRNYYEFEKKNNNSFFSFLVFENFKTNGNGDENMMMKGRYQIYNYPLPNYSTLLTRKKEIQFFATKNITKITDYNYSDFGQLLSETETTSNGAKKIEYMHPLDFVGSSNSVLESMRNMNVINPIIEKKEYIGSSIVNAEFYEYDLATKGIPLIKKAYHSELSSPVASFNGLNVDGTRKSSPYVLASTYSFNDNGNIVQYEKVNDISTSFLWGYNNKLPTAEVKNAKNDEISILDFESNSLKWEDNYGYNVNFTTFSTDAHTGKYSGLVSGVNNDGWLIGTDLIPGNQDGKYLLSAWVKVGAGYTADNMASLHYELYNADAGNSYISSTYSGIPNKSGWQYIEMPIDLSSITPKVKIGFGFKLSSTVSLYIDDIRFRPVNSQMNTYTYEPLYGVSSVTDANNRTTYYEYDNIGRLIRIKDDKGLVLKQNEYNYKH